MPKEVATPGKPSSSLFVDIRGERHHVMTWGDPRTRPLMMLHGWMDVGASFQFLVDELHGDWHVIAPDLRGFGRSAWQPGGYWFHDYVADLDALLRHFVGDAPTRLVGHSLGGNVVMHYAGVRPARVSHIVSLEGFGIPAGAADDAPARIARWLDGVASPPRFRPYAGFDSVADRLQRTNPRLTRDKAMFLARHWARALPDGRVELNSDPRHKIPFSHVHRLDEMVAVWSRIEAPVLWVAANESEIPRWIAGDRGPDDDELVEVRRRLSHVRNGRLVIIANAAHMVHHDQPAAVAAAIEPFLAA